MRAAVFDTLGDRKRQLASKHVVEPERGGHLLPLLASIAREGEPRCASIDVFTDGGRLVPEMVGETHGDGFPLVDSAVGGTEPSRVVAARAYRLVSLSNKSEWLQRPSGRPLCVRRNVREQSGESAELELPRNEGRRDRVAGHKSSTDLIGILRGSGR